MQAKSCEAMNVANEVRSDHPAIDIGFAYRSVKRACSGGVLRIRALNSTQLLSPTPPNDQEPLGDPVFEEIYPKFHCLQKVTRGSPLTQRHEPIAICR